MYSILALGTLFSFGSTTSIPKLMKTFSEVNAQ